MPAEGDLNFSRYQNGLKDSKDKKKKKDLDKVVTHENVSIPLKRYSYWLIFLRQMVQTGSYLKWLINDKHSR